jgi:hypothetical protein
MDFRSMDKLEKYIKNAINKSIKDKPPQAVKNLMMKHILRDVYSVYKPKIYQRRYTKNGLYDENNVVFKPRKNNTVEIYNKTKRNLNYSNQYLAPVIEFGHEGAKSKGYRGYSYPNPRYAYFYPRPFIKNTRNSLKQNKQHVYAFIQSLKSFGIKSEWKG